MKLRFSLFVLAALAKPEFSRAFWRLECRETSGIGRIDPIVSTGRPSEHVHIVFGGNNFGLSTTYDDLLASPGTSCAVLEDRSAYWTPLLYFQHSNGTFEMVSTVGGMLAYYLPFSQVGESVQAFPAGFRMIAGDSRQRNRTFDPALVQTHAETAAVASTQAGLSQAAIGFNCLHYANPPNEGTVQRHFIPDKSFMDARCTDGLRLEIYFPSCWNGADVDSMDHKSHMAYSNPVTGGFCPQRFQSRLPTLLYETIYDTYSFKESPGQFLLSNGDPTGYGYHADFMSGWRSETLQEAIDTCTNPSGAQTDCPVFNLQPNAAAAKFTFPVVGALKNEDVVGPMDNLPGEVPIQFGPQYASLLEPGLSRSSGPASGVIIPSSKSDIPTQTGFLTPTTTLTDDTGATLSLIAHNVKMSKAPQTPPTPGNTESVESSPSSPRRTSQVSQTTPTQTPTSTTTIWETHEENILEVFVAVVEVTVTKTVEPLLVVTETARRRRRGHLRRRPGQPL